MTRTTDEIRVGDPSVVVVDDEDAPIGVLSALDLLRLLPGTERWPPPSE